MQIIGSEKTIEHFSSPEFATELGFAEAENDYRDGRLVFKTFHKDGDIALYGYEKEQAYDLLRSVENEGVKILFSTEELGCEYWLEVFVVVY
ncbi:hypothetical protein [Microbulbifer spongiae]|uniref:Uncharacterized protein n=1 Tax=Microbulbifer spongiae TaxID=2944933 RepID=A0ABY9EBR2_9GAMM|nr:hypothetical protein [Microbulbifer sp. MI-G]WKD48216.1 hypothetical protein M8T91_09715 [Microbulbifer sp. MI-G]